MTEDIPKVIGRHHAWATGSGYIFLFVGVSVASGLWPVGVLVGMLGTGLFIWSWRAQGRVWRVVLENERRVCTVCAYPLPKEAAAGVCPECGGKYTLEAVRKQWSDFGEASGRTVELTVQER